MPQGEIEVESGRASSAATQVVDQKRRDDAGALMMDANTNQKRLKLPKSLAGSAARVPRGTK